MRWISVGISVLYVIFFAYAVYTLYEEPENPCKGYVFEPNATMNKTSDFDRCFEEYKNVKNRHDFNSFIILGIISVISMSASVLIRNKYVSSGILGGGTLLLIYSSLRYWGTLGNVVRLFIIGIGLCSLIYIALKK